MDRKLDSRLPPPISGRSGGCGILQYLVGKEKPPLDKAELKAPPGSTVTAKFSITATFSEPSEYILEVTANDWSGEGGRGFQCCWQRAGEVTVNL